MQNLQEYKCPCCGGAIAFDSTLQKLKCPYCDTEFEMEALRGYDAELQGEQADHMEWEKSAGGVWEEASYRELPKWKLDFTEGPMRMRCRLERDYLFYKRYPPAFMQLCGGLGSCGRPI